MSIPASRIKQIRAMFAKARQQMKHSIPMRRYEKDYVRYISKAGRGNLAAWVAGKPALVRKLRDWRVGKRVQHTDPFPVVFSRQQMIDDSRESQIIGHPAYETSRDMLGIGGSRERGNTFIKNSIVNRNLDWTWRKRSQNRKAYRHMKKLREGRSE